MEEWLTSQPWLESIAQVALVGFLFGIALLGVVSALMALLWLVRAWNGKREFVRRPFPTFSRMQIGKIAVDLKEFTASADDRLVKMEAMIETLSLALKEIKDEQSKRP